MHKAINAKFKKGDKVVWVSQGKRGVVTNPYAKGEYAVRFEGDRNDTWIAEEKLRAANCEVAANAKFRVGQLVKHTNGDTGVITVVNPANGFGDYQVRIVAGHGGFRGISSWDEEDLSVANCATTNAVVAKAVANARAVNSTDAAEATVAKNAGVKTGNFQVTLETVDFSGNRTQTKNMTADQLASWLRLIHCGSDIGKLVEAAEKNPSREFQGNVDMHPTITVKLI